VRLFVDAGLPAERLLYRAIEHVLAPDYARRLLAAFPQTDWAPQQDSFKSSKQPEDLIEPLESESFANVASYGSRSVPTSGAVTVDSGPLALTISYNAATQAYTVSDGVRSQTFDPGDLDAVQSSSTLTTYTITSGNTTESLSLTKPGTGAGQTRYVAAGFWQRQVNGATSVDGRFEAFAYGIRTPDGALPRSGFASFDVALLGAESFGSLVYALAGSGRVNASLQSGAIVGAGTYNKVNVATGAAENNHVWGFAAFLSANSNNFDGQIALTSVAGRGELHGAFFGPAAKDMTPHSDYLMALNGHRAGGPRDSGPR